MVHSLLLALLSVVPGPTAAIPQQAVSSTQQTTVRSQNILMTPVTIAVKEGALEAVLIDISNQAGLKPVLGGDVRRYNKRVSMDVSNIPASSALDRALKGTGIVYQMFPNNGIGFVAQVKAIIAQGIVTGRVTDAKSGKGITGASVSLESNAQTATTGEDGVYRLAAVPAGSHTVTVRLVGYSKQTRQVTVGEGATATANFTLEPTANVLNEIVVTGTIVATELKAVPNAITVITAKEIEERGITRLDQLFRGDVPGLFAQNLGSVNPLDSVVMFSRGASMLTSATNALPTNPIKTYLDGVELARPEYLSQIDPRSIDRVEIIAGPQASAIYGSNALNGVMQIFTKRGSTARPQVVLNFMSGVIQNNYTTALSPIHTYDGRISGTEGRLSFNGGASWDYTGRWTPARQTQRISLYGGGKIQLHNLTLDGTVRRGLTQNKQTGSAEQTITDMGESGVLAPSAQSGLSAPTNARLTGRTVGLSLKYASIPWWSHELSLGSDASYGESISPSPRYGSISAFDTSLSFIQSENVRNSQRYTTTIQTPRLALVSLTLTVGADHWRNRSFFMAVEPSTLTGNLGTPSNLTRGKPGSNTGSFVQAQFGVQDALFFTYGLRAEWNPNYGDDYGTNFAPRYGMAYSRNIGSLTTKLRASYGRATRPPTQFQKLSLPATSTRDLGIYGPYDTRLANPELGPEYQQGGEGGLEFYLGNRGSLVITRYNQTVDALILRVNPVDSVRSILPGNSTQCAVKPDGYCYSQQSQHLNVGSLRNQGWEMQGSVSTGPFTTRGTYSWTKSRILGITSKYRALLTSLDYQTGASFNYLPEHTWMVGITYARAGTTMSLNVNGTGALYRSIDDVNIAVQGLLTPPRLDMTKPRMLLPPLYRPKGPGYAMSDLNVSHRWSGAPGHFLSNVEGVLQIQNLGNFYQNDYRAINATIGRQSKAGLRIRL